ncbi:MAG TPA: tripartite tricarboxylate transporter substrate-binding protein [Chloroflexota bacterium]|nr:tripartite tricarboxylate transporter substrate-binding protein [Chloroflexota bacterium]
MQRRRLLLAVAGLPVLAAACGGAGAPGGTAPGAATGSGPVTSGGFPSKTLRIMAPADPGGGWDGTARNLKQVLDEEKIAAQPVEVFNRGGAGGTVGLAEFVTQHRGDGHTTMVMGLVMTGAILTNKSPVNLGMVTPLARLTTEYEAIAVAKDSKYQSLQELMDDFKKDPRGTKWGGGSAGGTDHILVGLLAQVAGVAAKDINYIAFSGGGELRPQVIGNQVTAGVSGFGEFKGDAQAGNVRILAVTGPSRLPGSDVPTAREAGTNIELTNWRGIVGPPGMRDGEKRAWLTMLTRLNDSKSWKDTLTRLDWTDAFLAGDQFAAFLKQEDERVAKVLKDIGLV